MAFQIDQSGKIEDTSKSTIIALANGTTLVLKISSQEKRKLLPVMRKLDFPKKIFIYRAFTALIFLILKHTQITTVTIDKEYPGHEAFIKTTLINLFGKEKMKPPTIHFALVGKTCTAHKAAIEGLRKKRKPDFIVRANDVLELLYGLDHKKRLEFPRRAG